MPNLACLDAAHEETCLLLQRKAELMRMDKEAELRALEASDENNEFQIEALRRELQDMEEFPEFLEYMAEFGELVSGHSEVAAPPIAGPIGNFVEAALVSDEGSRLAMHEDRFAGPVRRWHELREATEVNGGVRPKHKRRARESSAQALGAAISRVGAESAQGQRDVTISNDLRDNSMAYGDRQADYLRPRGGYKRVNHMSECLNQRQGKETTKIPPSLVETMMAERKKHSWMRSEDITSDHIRQWLRKNNLAGWYEHIPRIRAIVTGTPPPNLSPSQDERVRAMFRQCEIAFERVPPDIRQRRNFLTYDYVIFKIFEICGIEDLLEDYKLLKTAERIEQHDRVWEHICGQLGWTFIPTSLI